MMYDELKERIIETNYYLTNAMINGNLNELVKRKAELDSLIKEILLCSVVNP